jgi:hypothetical protein
LSTAIACYSYYYDLKIPDTVTLGTCDAALILADEQGNMIDVEARTGTLEIAEECTVHGQVLAAGAYDNPCSAPSLPPQAPKGVTIMKQ